ncbi:MAG: Biogenesis of lysosome-related organelles complex-1 subunit 2 [Rhodobacteraceae bacterium HLUCCA12]|nr:MAG: Biogenesis of lysosome-related organelles complex-1 subunit 2 [Rhodobacteraceae bacterium HLUCCA12]
MADLCSMEEIRSICAEVAGVDLISCDQPTAQEINRQAFAIFGSALPLAWENPSKIETEIDGIIRDIRKLRQRIIALDGYAKSLARKHAVREKEQEILDSIVASAGDSEKMAEAVRQFDEFSKRPKELWVDIAALSHLDALEQALTGPAEVAIAATPPGAGRRPNRRAYRVALVAARVFQDLTGTNPTFWNGGETPFSRMVAKIYRCAGIKADLRKPIEAAMHELSGAS